MVHVHDQVSVVLGTAMAAPHRLVPESLHHICQDVACLYHLSHNHETADNQAKEGRLRRELRLSCVYIHYSGT